MAHPDHIEAILQTGAAKARALAAPLLAELRQAVGLRSFSTASVIAVRAKAAKAALPLFKQYREADGKFYFKLNAADGSLLLQSQGLDSGRDAGQWVARLKREGAAALSEAPVQRAAGITAADVEAALAELKLASEG